MPHIEPGAGPTRPNGVDEAVGEPQRLFQSFMLSGTMGDFAPCRDGDRLLLVEQAAQGAPISLFLNWMDALATR